MPGESLYDWSSLRALVDTQEDVIKTTVGADVQEAAVMEKLDVISNCLRTLLEMRMEEKLAKQEKSFAARMDRAMDYMHDKFEDLSTSLGTGVDNLKKLFGSFLEKMQKIGTEISKKAKELGGDIKDKAVEFKNFVKGKLGYLAEHMQTFYKDTMKPALEKAGGEAKAAFDKAVEKIKPHMEAAADRVADAYLGAKHGMGTAVRKAGEKLRDAGASMEDRAHAAKRAKSLSKKKGLGKFD